QQERESKPKITHPRRGIEVEELLGEFGPGHGPGVEQDDGMSNGLPAHKGQSGRRATRTLRKVMSARSHSSSQPARGSPRPASNLIASTAPSEPITPDTAPKTGNCRRHNGGGSG